MVRLVRRSATFRHQNFPGLAASSRAKIRAPAGLRCAPSFRCGPPLRSAFHPRDESQSTGEIIMQQLAKFLAATGRRLRILGSVIYHFFRKGKLGLKLPSRSRSSSTSNSRSRPTGTDDDAFGAASAAPSQCEGCWPTDLGRYPLAFFCRASSRNSRTASSSRSKWWTSDCPVEPILPHRRARKGSPNRVSEISIA